MCGQSIPGAVEERAKLAAPYVVVQDQAVYWDPYSRCYAYGRLLYEGPLASVKQPSAERLLYVISRFLHGGDMRRKPEFRRRSQI